MQMTKQQKNQAKSIKKLFNELKEAKREKFPDRGKSLGATKEKGVYIIENARGSVLHVGSTPRAREGIHNRLRAHLAGNSSFVGTYLKGKYEKLRQRHYYRCLAVRNPRQRALLEHYATGCLSPKHIGCGKD